MSGRGERARRTRDVERARLLGTGRLGVFVPAVMSVGLVFWVVTEVIELLRSRADEVRDRRARLFAAETAACVLAEPLDAPPEARGLRPRGAYALLAATLLAGAAYVVVGSAANWARSGGYVHHVSWLLAAAVAAGIVASLFAAAAFVVAARWPAPPARIVAFVQRTPLGTTPLSPEERFTRPPWQLDAAIAAAIAAAAVLTAIVAWSPHVVDSFDRSSADWLAAHDPLAALAVLDPIGSTGVGIGLALLTGLAAARCRVLAASIAMTTTVGLLLSLSIRPLVDQARPEAGPLAGGIDSYPSGHILLAVLLAGIIPSALAVLLDRRSIVLPLRVLLGIGVVASATHRVADRIHWTTDALGGALMGLALVLAAEWALQNQRSHRACHHCPWSAHPASPDLRGAIPIHPSAHRALQLLAHLVAALGAAGLAFVALRIELPVDTDGYAITGQLQTQVQIGLALLASAGALLAWRWEAAGALVLALAAAAIGIFSAAEYDPVVGVALTALAMVPAALLWLSWQHRRRAHEVVALAVATSLLVGGSWVGASAVRDHLFGPTHPDSVAIDPRIEDATWLWAGAVEPTSVTVVARLADEGEDVHLELVAPGEAPVRTEAVRPDERRLVRLRADGLRPATAYEYHLVVDGEPDRRRGTGRLRTPAVGAQSFTVTAGACARSGSNGAVFDAIRGEDPDLHLIIGDLHYDNIEEPSVDRFVDALERALTTPAQGALVRSVPIAYVWDDHDYGPNDADAASPSRSAARAAYRAAVPSYEVPEGDAPIYQAFTRGRVRFILTDERSERRGPSMLGDEQLAWFLDELRTSAESHAAVVWVSSVPWIGEADPSSDGWSGAADERRTIADAIAAAGIDNLVMVSGDAHMVAIDDGTNSDYSTAGGGGFPVLHAAALDRPGNVKGGPYSEGAFPGGGQYGVLRIDDDGGDEIGVRLEGKRWDGTVLVGLDLRFAAG